MSDREQAIKDVAAELGCDADILSHQMDMDPKFICNNGEYKVYAVSQRERVIQLERALREIQNREETVEKVRAEKKAAKRGTQ